MEVKTLFLITACLIAVTHSQNVPVSIIKAESMTQEMQNDALDVFRRTSSLNSNDRCVFVGDYFQKKYPDSIWHIAEYTTYYIRHILRINVQVGDKKYVLFAT